MSFISVFLCPVSPVDLVRRVAVLRPLPRLHAARAQGPQRQDADHRGGGAGSAGLEGLMGQVRTSYDQSPTVTTDPTTTTTIPTT